MSRSRVVGTVTRPQAGRSGVRILKGARDLQKRPDHLWRWPSLLFNRYRGSFPGIGGQCLRLTTHVHLVPRLRMSGAIPLLPHIPSWCGQRRVYR